MCHMRLIYGGVMVLICVVVGSPPGWGQEEPWAVFGKEFIERLTRLEEGQRGLEHRMVEGFTALGQRMDNTNKRIDDTNQRIDDTNQRIGELREFMLWGFGITFAGMFTLVGFVIWDRRTALAPAVRRMQEMEEREQRLEAALKEYAKKSPELADSLRKMGLL